MHKYKHVSISDSIFSKDGTIIAAGFTRIVYGARGAYAEFSNGQIDESKLVIPKEQKWRVNNCFAYYSWYVVVGTNIKVYHQKRTTDYADYKKDMWYISPVDLKDFV